MTEVKLSAVILTKNEAKNIGRCIESLKFCDEVIVIDDYSDDRTTEIAKNQGATVVQRHLSGDFSAQRNFGMEQAQGEWILFIDADEEVSEELREEIEHVQTKREAYYLKRRDYWWGREMQYGETKKVRNKGLIRLMKKHSGMWEGTIHESFRSHGSTGQLHGFINHYPHPTLAEFIAEINIYSTLRAKELLKQGKKATIVTTLFYPLGKFILTYFIYLGFLDGPPGFAYSFFMAFHSFLVRAKLYQYTNYRES